MGLKYPFDRWFRGLAWISVVAGIVFGVGVLFQLVKQGYGLAIVGVTAAIVSVVVIPYIIGSVVDILPHEVDLNLRGWL